MQEFNEERFNELMAKKEEKEKLSKIEVKADPNKPETWDDEMVADYFIWMLKKRPSKNVESVVDMFLEKLKVNKI